MLRVVEDRSGLAFFRNRTLLHHCHAIGNFRNNAEVMRDEQNRCFLPPLQIPDQRQDLCLGGNVQRGCRFVSDQDPRVERQRHGDHGPLALATRQLMWIGARGGFWVGDAHVFEQR